MKILMVSSYLPYPLFSGGQVRLFNLIKELSGKHGITLICEKRDNQTQNDIKEVEKICKKVVTVKRRKQWSFGNLMKTSMSSNSFLTIGHANGEMTKKIIEELDKNNFDLIHVETYYVMQNLPKTSLPIVLAEHNIEYQVYARFVDQASPALRPLFALDIKKIKKEEENCWKSATKLIAVSKEDAKVMENQGLSPAVVANGVDTGKFSFRDSKSHLAKASRERKILFIGDFKWLQNRDSAKFIIDEVWPIIKLRLKTKNLKSKLWIVGREVPDSIRSLSNDPSIIFDEENSTRPTQELFHEADLLLSPIRVGGGTSYKILESMSSGTPVVTTQMSAESLDAKDGKEIMIGKDASELAEKTVRLFMDNKLYETIAKNARDLIVKNYTWDKIAKDLDKVYRELGIRN